MLPSGAAIRPTVRARDHHISNCARLFGGFFFYCRTGKNWLSPFGPYVIGELEAPRSVGLLFDSPIRQPKSC
jgi:hypothetical protein